MRCHFKIPDRNKILDGEKLTVQASSIRVLQSIYNNQAKWVPKKQALHV